MALGFGSLLDGHYSIRNDDLSAPGGEWILTLIRALLDLRGAQAPSAVTGAYYNKKKVASAESTEHVSKTPATHAAASTHPSRNAPDDTQAAYVQHRFRFEMGLSPWGPISPDVLSPRTPVHEGATGERSTAEHYGQRRTSQTCCPKLPRCHGLWLFAPPRCPVWLPAAGRAGIRLLTHASSLQLSLQSWRIGVTERLTD
jgi:hypothetical protein